MRAPNRAIVINPRVRGYSVRRYYDPQTGQFISVDPLIDQTQAPYAYVGDDPIDNTDPSGLDLCLFGHCVYTHSFDPMASVDAWINIGRGATFGLTDRIANWISPGASCTVPQNSLDQALGNAATGVLGVEALGVLARVRALQAPLGFASDLADYYFNDLPDWLPDGLKTKLTAIWALRAPIKAGWQEFSDWLSLMRSG